MRRIMVMTILTMLIAMDAAAGESFRVAAKAAIIIEADTGRVLYAQNSDEMLPMASTTKLMTCLLALENGDLSSRITAPAEASGVPGTSIYLTEGETLTLEQLLYGLMLRSGNDAATAIGIHIGGSTQEFVAMMNARAAELEIDASFKNPHGLDAEGHAASAAALAGIMREALKNEDFRRIVGTQKKLIPWEGNEYSRVLYNKNRLLSSYEGAIGGKTGYTGDAGRCLVFAAERRNMTLIGCVLNCSTWFDTAERLLDYGFENYESVQIFEAGEMVEKVKVTGGREPSVNVIAAEELAVPLGIDEDYMLNIELKPAAAPIHAGGCAGFANVLIDGDLTASVELQYAADVPENDLEAALRRIIEMWVLRL